MRCVLIGHQTLFKDSGKGALREDSGFGINGLLVMECHFQRGKENKYYHLYFFFLFKNEEIEAQKR